MDSSPSLSNPTYHISGGFIHSPIDLSFSLPVYDLCGCYKNTHDIEYLKNILQKYKHRMVYFEPDYKNLTRLDETTWKISMILKDPPDYVCSVLPAFQSYPHAYKQKIIAFNIHIWEGNALEAFEYNACDIIIRKTI